jgi:hypothetical protein
MKKLSADYIPGMLSTILSRIFCVPVFSVRTTILHVVLYKCETWSLTLRKEHGLRVFENRALTKILVSKREGVVGG